MSPQPMRAIRVHLPLNVVSLSLYTDNRNENTRLVPHFRHSLGPFVPV